MRRYRHRKNVWGWPTILSCHREAGLECLWDPIQSQIPTKPTLVFFLSIQATFHLRATISRVLWKKNLERLYIWSSTGWSHGCSQLSSTSCLCSTLNPTKQDTLIVCSIHVYRIETPSLGRHRATDLSINLFLMLSSDFSSFVSHGQPVYKLQSNRTRDADLVPVLFPPPESFDIFLTSLRHVLSPRETQTTLGHGL